MTAPLYDAALKELARRPKTARDGGTLPHRARVSNPLCGDRVDLMLATNESGKIADIAIETRACLLCEASAGGLASLARGLDADDLQDALRTLRVALQGDEFKLPEALAAFRPFEGARPHRSRHACILLPFEAALEALAGAAARKPGEG